jgi:drug/metabolite transporter (DMT)-like permease
MNVIWMILAGLFLSVVGVLVKVGAHQFSSTELAFYRSFFSLIFLYSIMKFRGHKVQRTNLKRHLGRSLAGIATTLLFFHVLTTLPLATATTLTYTSPLFLALLSIFWLKEKVHFPQILTLGAGFAGVVILLGPSITPAQLPDAMLGLASGFFAGVAYMNVRGLSRDGEPAWNIVFYFSLIATLVTGLLVLLQPMHPVTLQNIWIIAGTGIFGTVGQLFLTKAYQGGQTIVTGAFNYTTLIFSSLFGAVLWHEFLSPVAWAGMAILIGSGIVMIVLSSRHPHSKAPA